MIVTICVLKIKDYDTGRIRSVETVYPESLSGFIINDLVGILPSYEGIVGYKATDSIMEIVPDDKYMKFYEI